jgi:predicted Zn-dependent protease
MTTFAEMNGMTLELGRYAARVAQEALARGRMEEAQQILEGLAAFNPEDGATWCLLAELHRRAGRDLAARICAEIALKLDPKDVQLRLMRAVLLIGNPEERSRGCTELEELAAGVGPAADRARALRQALANAPS